MKLVIPAQPRLSVHGAATPGQNTPGAKPTQQKNVGLNFENIRNTLENLNQLDLNQVPGTISDISTGVQNTRKAFNLMIFVKDNIILIVGGIVALFLITKRK